MEQQVKELMNDQLLDQAAITFGLRLSDLQVIGGFQNFVYEYEKNGKNYIFRMTHSSHRNANQVRGELEWIQYLYDHGVSVSRPIPSQHDRLVEVIEQEDSYFIITSFEKALGKKIFYPECMNNDSLSELCGEMTGQIHELSKRYVPSGKSITRHHWTDNYYLTHMKKFIPSHQYEIFEGFGQLTNQINLLNKEARYGLIHGDINVANFMLDHNKITLFDFDECQYSWYVEDIAIQLFYMVYVVLNDSIQERNNQARRFLHHFLKGYERHTAMDSESLHNIGLFLRLRELIVYIGMHRSFDLTNLDDWTSTYIQESRVRLEKGIPIVEELLGL
ncbi:phosphotransferase [Paenibacillus terrigena]|uniref:phosphotransferase enzyme family protein n=1 Tax=Paenibacillus terrigena TaxID=369333 RepID=UPI0028D597FF|nr:phosphotransferase [Paenibacillus terrigena]